VGPPRPFPQALAGTDPRELPGRSDQGLVKVVEAQCGRNAVALESEECRDSHGVRAGIGVWVVVPGRVLLNDDGFVIDRMPRDRSQVDAGVLDPVDEHVDARCLALRPTDHDVFCDRGSRGIDVLVARADAGGATINDIAAELGIDQSGASRMVAHAVAQGFLAKDVAVDARQRIVSVTEAGRTLVSQAHTWQETTFARLTADWSPADIARFTALMTRLVASREDEL
jgi:MarR family transcriptional regulator, organic hydroperoxide resistance regulator